MRAPASITGSSMLAEELTAAPWTDANLRKLASKLKGNDSDGLAFCFNEFVQACVKARWREPLEMFVRQARKNSQHKSAVEAILARKSIRWKTVEQTSLKLPLSTPQRNMPQRKKLHA